MQGLFYSIYVSDRIVVEVIEIQTKGVGMY